MLNCAIVFGGSKGRKKNRLIREYIELLTHNETTKLNKRQQFIDRIKQCPVVGYA